MSFPKKVWGRCEAEGHTGPAYDSVSSADYSDPTDEGTGYELVPYHGKHVCKPCSRRLQNEAESRSSARKHERETKFRAKAGFERT